MSDRDKQNKHNRDSNISGSMYARVNVGNDVNNANNGSRQNNIAGSMNNSDEKNTDYNSSSHSFLYTVLFYVIGFGLSVAYMYIGLWIFNDYFNSPESKEFLPAAASIVIPVILGFLSSKIILNFAAKYL